LLVGDPYEQAWLSRSATNGPELWAVIGRCLSPAKSIEKSGDLDSGAIRILAMWEVPHIREQRKV
jgi:hypothetical protein